MRVAPGAAGRRRYFAAKNAVSPPSAGAPRDRVADARADAQVVHRGRRVDACIFAPRVGISRGSIGRAACDSSPPSDVMV
jgi:hypothetical protein